MPDDRPQLTDEDVVLVLSRPGGWYHLMELAVMGRIDSERAVTAIERADRTPFPERLGMALLDTLFFH